jgi:uncharacterized protein YyaL (SSP411 family)
MNYKLFRPHNLKLIVSDYLNQVGPNVTDEQALKNIFSWILASFDATPDNGSSAYFHVTNDWQSSYPETTGYLIPTMLEYAEYMNDNDLQKRAYLAAQWLVEIQMKCGGWEGGQVGKGNEPRVFNTAMILDGLVAVYQHSGNEEFLESAICGYNWLVSVLDDNGTFTKYNVSEGGSFDLLTLACMCRVGQYLDQIDTRILDSVKRHKSFQASNSWWSNCNFKSSYPNTALLHHLGYTLDGLLIIDEILGTSQNLESVRKTALKLLSLLEVNLKLPAYILNDWSIYYDLGIKAKKYSMCLTGNSQIAIVFLKLSKLLDDLRFANAAYKLIDINKSISNRKFGHSGLDYGLSGSYPIFGNYQKFQFVNWAAKYHAESILLAIDKSKSRRIEK